MKEIDFSGKVAVVTGAASGMGLMTAQEFARLGAKVVMCDVNAHALDAAAKSIGEAAKRRIPAPATCASSLTLRPPRR